jgi:hypothetical protein
MARRITVLLAASCVTVVWMAPAAHAQTSREGTRMSEDIAGELKQLRLNQAVLMAAINRIIVDTAPIELVNPADASSGFVTTGLILSADGTIVPGRIPAPAPQATSRGLRPGDPLWVGSSGSP